MTGGDESSWAANGRHASLGRRGPLRAAHTRPRDAMAPASTRVCGPAARLAAGPPSCSRATDPASRRGVSSPPSVPRPHHVRGGRREAGTRALGSLGGTAPDEGRARRRARARADPPSPFPRIAPERAAERAPSAHVAAAFAVDRRGAPVDDGERAARLDCDLRRARASPLDPDGDVLLEEGASLADYCTLGVGGPARFLAEVRTPEALAAVLRRAARARLPCVVIGKGSNVLFHDRGFEGVVVVNCVDFIERAADDDDRDHDGTLDGTLDGTPESSTPSAYSSSPTHARFRVGAGYPFNQLGATLSREGFAGLEFAAGVPGTVGGAVFMNAGADGQDTASALSSVECVSPDGSRRVVVDAAELRFGYRRSPFMRDDVEDDEEDGKERDSNSRGVGRSSRDLDLRGWIVVAATFRVRADAAAADRAREFLRRRRETQPLAERSVGCVFRNPGPGVRSAGALIDAAGLKGTRCGGAEVSPAHANFLVYRRRERDDASDDDDDKYDDGSALADDGATGGASEFDALIRRVKRAVFDATGVELREEVRRVPPTLEPAPIANEADDPREEQRPNPR